MQLGSIRFRAPGCNYLARSHGVNSCIGSRLCVWCITCCRPIVDCSVGLLLQRGSSRYHSACGWLRRVSTAFYHCFTPGSKASKLTFLRILSTIGCLLVSHWTDFTDFGHTLTVLKIFFSLISLSVTRDRLSYPVVSYCL